MVVFNWFGVLSNDLDVDTDGGHLSCFFDAHSVLVNTLDNDRLEVSVPTGTEHELLIERNLTLEDSSSKNETHTLGIVSRVNDELSRYVSLSWVTALALLDVLMIVVSIIWSIRLLQVNVLLSDYGLWEHGKELAEEVYTLS